MASSARRAETRIAVFARAPVPGEAKTRLIPGLGPEGAAALHERLVRRALRTARDARVGPVELWCAPDASHPFFAACATELAARLFEQRGSDLGERMDAAFGAALGDNAALVVIGSDCPALTPVALREARKIFADRIAYAERAMDALHGADALVIVTEWQEFRSPDFGAIRAALREPVLFDGRNMFAPQLPEAAGLEYHAIGRRTNGLNGPHAFDGSNERPGYVCADAAA